MKTLASLIAVLLYCTNCYCQAETLCSADLKKVGSELKGTSVYFAPCSEGEQRICPSKAFIKSLSALSLRFTCETRYLDVNRRGVIIKFEDGSIKEYPEVKIEPEVEAAPIWKYTGFLTIPEGDINYFVTKRIVQANMSFNDFNLDEAAGNKVLYYLQCLNKLTK